MKRGTDNSSLYVFLILLVLSLIISYFIIKPFIGALLWAFVVAFTFNPVTNWLEKIVKKRFIATIITLLLVVLIVTLPFILLTNSLINESVEIYFKAQNLNIEGIAQKVSTYLEGQNFDLNFYFKQGINKSLQYILNSLSDFAFHIPQRAVRTVMFLFATFYFLYDGKAIVGKIKDILPLKDKHKEGLITRLKEGMYAATYGLIVVSVIQGIIATIGLVIFKVPSPLLWGVVSFFLILLPIVGAAMVWLPAAIYKIALGDLFNGIGLIIYGTLVLSSMDYILKPKLIGAKARIHPLIIILGVFGGLALFGFTGVIIGPVLLMIAKVFLEVYKEERS